MGKKAKILVIIGSCLLTLAYATYFILVQGNVSTLIIGIVFLVIYLTSLKEKKENSSLYILGNMSDDNPKTDSQNFDDKSIRKEPMGNFIYLIVGIIFLILTVAFA